MELIKLKDNTISLDCEFEETIIEYHNTKKKLDEIEKSIRKRLLDAMEKNNVKSIKTDNIIITYKDSYDRETFNSKEFRKDHADLYDEYVSFSTTKPSLLIKVSDND